MPQGMMDDLRWVLVIAFTVWLALGLAFGLRKGVRAGVVLYGVAALVLTVAMGLFGLFLLAVATPFGAAAGLAGAWLGDLLRPALAAALAAVRRRRA